MWICGPSKVSFAFPPLITKDGCDCTADKGSTPEQGGRRGCISHARALVADPVLFPPIHSSLTRNHPNCFLLRFIFGGSGKAECQPSSCAALQIYTGLPL